MKIKTEIEIDDSRIADLLCCGMEGGIGYWAVIVDYVQPPVVWTAKGWDDDVYKHIQWPMSQGGAVILEEIEEEKPKRLTLDRAALERGLQLMANDPDYKHHFANFLNETDDAETGDVFIQFAVLGKVVYG